jgi:hypothetical protein
VPSSLKISVSVAAFTGATEYTAHNEKIITTMVSQEVILLLNLGKLFTPFRKSYIGLYLKGLRILDNIS